MTLADNSDPSNLRWSEQRRGFGCAMLFVLPFAGIGVWILGLMLIQIKNWGEAAFWVEHPAKILSAEFNVGSGGDGGQTYRVNSTYEYHVQGQRYLGDRVWLSRAGDSVGSFHRRNYEELCRFRDSGQPFRCYVDPTDATRSVLYRDLRPGLLAFSLLFVVTFGGVGAYGLINLWKLRRRIQQAIVLAELHPTQPWLWENDEQQSEYQPKATWREPLLTCLLAISLGSVFCVVFWQAIRTEPAIRFLLLFPIIGVFMIYPAFRSVRRRLRQGVPRLIANPWPLRVGATASFQIQCENFPPEGTPLAIELTVQRPRGNDDGADVVAKVIANTTVAADQTFRLEMELPADAPPSKGILDTSKANTGDWTVRVHDPSHKWGFDAVYTIHIYA